MKALLVIATTVSLLSAACADDMNINGRSVSSIGLVNQAAKGSDIVGVSKPVACVQYRIVWGNVVWGALLIETVIAPIYFYGFSMFEPAGTTPECAVSKQV